MRFESSVLSLSWIPSEAVRGMPRVPFDLGLTKYDDPPPDTVTDFRRLVEADRVRFANELRAWVEVEDGRITSAGYGGGGHLNISRVHLGGMDLRFAAVALPDLQHEPVHHDGSVTFVQTAGGRTGMPAPRRVSRRPFVQVIAPLAWTTLSLTIDAAGHTEPAVVGASPFPRHWVYDAGGRLVAKTGSIDFKSWYREAFGTATPWGDTESPAFVTEAETALERQLSRQIMKRGTAPMKKRFAAGEDVVRQGEPGQSLLLLLDGVLEVDVDGRHLAEIGPGAILGERALLETGRRTSTLRALTPCLVAIAPAEDLDPKALAEVSQGHRREEQQPS